MNHHMIRPAILAALAIVIVGCAGSGTSSGPSAPPVATDERTASPPAAPVSVTLRDFKIVPATLTGSASMTINVSNEGPTPHNLTVRDAADATVAASKDLRTGGSDTVVLPGLPAGDYTIFCSFAGHESLGMRGTLTVTP